MRGLRVTASVSISLSLCIAAGCSEGSALRSIPEFSGDAALALVKKQTDFGPRVPGSEANQRALEWMESFLEPLAEVVQRQPFTAHNPFSGENVTSTNLIASFYPQNRRRIMLCAHWDSRPVADREIPIINEPILLTNLGSSLIARKKPRPPMLRQRFPLGEKFIQLR